MANSACSLLLCPSLAPSSSSIGSPALSSSCSSFFPQVQGFLKPRSSLVAPASKVQHRRRRLSLLRVDASINFGDFGGRDPFPAEVESNFGDKVLGNEGTEHIILIPPSLLGLAERSCSPLPRETLPLTEVEATALLRKVIGWRLSKTDEGLKIWTEWKLKDFTSGVTLLNRIAAVAEAEKQIPDLHLLQGNKARAELSTSEIGGLSVNDFIFAAKIDKIKTSDLVKKNKFWA